MGNNLDTKITADIVDLQQKFAVARAETQSLSSEMNKLAKEAAAGTLDTAGQSTFAQLAQDYLQAKTQAAGYSAEIKQSTEATKSLGESIEEARGQLSTLFQATGAAVALEAIEKVGEAILGLSERASQVQSMADVLGVTTDQFQAMAAAADSAGVSNETLTHANEQLTATLAKARDNDGEAIEKLAALGITLQQVRDPAFNLQAALAVVGPRLRDGATHAQEMSAAVQLLGARTALAAAAWQAYDASAAGVAASMSRINGLTKEQNQAWLEQGITLKETGGFLENTGAKFALMAESAVGAAVKAELALKNLATGAAVTQAIMAGASHGGASYAPQIAQIQQLQDVTVTAQRRMTTATLQAEQDQVAATAAGTAQRLASARELYEDTLRFYQGDTSVAQVRAAYREMESADKEYVASQTASFREELNQAKETFTQEIAAYKQSRSQIDAAAKESQTIVAQDASTDIAIARMNVEAKKQLLEADVANTAQASAQKFAALKELTNQEFAQDEQELEVKLSLLTAGTAAYNAAYNDIRTLKAKNVLDLAALDNQAAEASKRAAEQDATAWKAAVNEIESAESSLIGDLLSKRKSLSESLLQVTSSMLQKEIADDAKAVTTRLLSNEQGIAQQKALEQGGLLYHEMVELQKTNLEYVQVTARTSAQQAAAATQTAATASAAAAQQAVAAASGSQLIMSDAAKAFAGTFASVAQIPYVGYIMAPGAAAAAFAEVASMAGMASLDVGAWNVPHDMVAQIHKGESVVPTTFAQGMRESGGLGQAEQGAGGDIHIHNHMSAFDDTGLRGMVTSPKFRQAMMDAARMHFSRGGR